MTKYCKCGHKKSEHSSRLGEVDFTGADEYGSYRGWQKSGQLLAFTGLACDGGIFHHSHWEYHDPKMKDTVQLDNCLCPKFRLSKHQKYQAKRWKNTIVYDKTRGLIESGMGKYTK